MKHNEFFGLTKNKLLLTVAFLITNLVSPFFSTELILLNIVAYYIVSCFIMWFIRTAMRPKKSIFHESNLRYMRWGSLVMGFISLMFGFIFLDLTFVVYLKELGFNFFNFVTGFLLAILGTVLMALYIVISRLETSFFVKFLSYPTGGHNAENVSSLISIWALALSISLFFYNYFGLTNFYTVILSLIIIAFLWLSLKLEI